MGGKFASLRPQSQRIREGTFLKESGLDELVHLIKARRRVAVLGPRMVGKTSFVKAANTRLENGNRCSG